ncbi:MAG: HI1506-related protein [Gemmatimonadaceae bacterium]
MSIRITARPRNGFRRAGVFHPGEPTVYPDDYFTAEEIKILCNEPQLIVELLEGDEGLERVERRLQLVDRDTKGDKSDRGGPDGSDSGTSNSGAERPDASAAPSTGDVGGGQQSQPGDVAADRTADTEATEATEATKEVTDSIPTPPAVADLEEFLSNITDIAVVKAMQANDTRKSAQPIYEEWIDQLTPGAKRQGG